MKNHLLTFALVVIATFASAQQKGPGKIISKTYDYKNFDKLTFIGFNDDITVKMGSAFKVEIKLKESNLNNLIFDYQATETKLTIKVKPVSGMKLYGDRDSYQITIEMPEISMLKNTGNANVNIQNIIGRYFRAETTGNGDIICSGSVDVFDVDKTGNGDVDAKNLKAKSSSIESAGNGNVFVNVSEKITAKNIGNGDVKNSGKAKFDSKSKTIGNGDLIEN
jgi:hypothetical protein